MAVRGGPAAVGGGRAVVVVGHGSRVAAGNAQFEACVAALRRALAPTPVSHCYIELALPDMETGLAAAASHAAAVDVLPAVLLPAGHLRRDIPGAISRVQARFPQVRFRLARHLGTGTPVRLLLLERLQAASAGLDRRHARLVVLGRGSSDRRANAAVQTLTRILQHDAGFGSASTAFAGVVEPSLPAVLAAAGDVDHVVILPFLLFDGVLLRDMAAQAAASGLDVRVAGPLGGDAGLPRLLLQRLNSLTTNREVTARVASGVAN